MVRDGFDGGDSTEDGVFLGGELVQGLGLGLGVGVGIRCGLLVNFGSDCTEEEEEEGGRVVMVRVLREIFGFVT